MERLDDIAGIPAKNGDERMYFLPVILLPSIFHTRSGAEGFSVIDYSLNEDAGIQGSAG
ncbi:MAG: hypothetical protein V8S42_04310 [Lachnospiraceae bacterium]